MSKRALATIWVLVLFGCPRESEYARLCLSGDLGTYRLEKMEEKPKGCLATYVDPNGLRARVELSGGRPFVRPERAVPFPFEKHIVYSQRKENGVRAVWHRGDLTVDMLLEGFAVPQGAVLRAYLFEYRSEVTDDVEAAREEVRQLKESSRGRPQDAQVHLELARKYRKLNDTLMAAQEYHIAVDADRSCHACYLEMGTLYFELKHWDLSIRALRRAAALLPQDARPVLLLGDVYYHVRNGQEALRAYRHALEMGLEGEERQRASDRIEELKQGKYMIEVLPGAKKTPGDR